MRISDWSSDVCSSDLGAKKVRGDPMDPRVNQRFLHAGCRFEGDGNRTRNLRDWNPMRYHYATPPQEHLMMTIDAAVGYIRGEQGSSTVTKSPPNNQDASGMRRGVDLGLAQRVHRVYNACRIARHTHSRSLGGRTEKQKQ